MREAEAQERDEVLSSLSSQLRLNLQTLKKDAWLSQMATLLRDCKYQCDECAITVTPFSRTALVLHCGMLRRLN